MIGERPWVVSLQTSPAMVDRAIAAIIAETNRLRDAWCDTQRSWRRHAPALSALWFCPWRTRWGWPLSCATRNLFNLGLDFAERFPACPPLGYPWPSASRCTQVYPSGSTGGGCRHPVGEPALRSTPLLSPSVPVIPKIMRVPRSRRLPRWGCCGIGGLKGRFPASDFLETSWLGAGIRRSRRWVPSPTAEGGRTRA